MLIYETIYGDWIFLEIRRILEHAGTDLFISFVSYEQRCQRILIKWI